MARRHRSKVLLGIPGAPRSSPPSPCSDFDNDVFCVASISEGFSSCSKHFFFGRTKIWAKVKNMGRGGGGEWRGGFCPHPNFRPSKKRKMLQTSGKTYRNASTQANNNVTEQENTYQFAERT